MTSYLASAGVQHFSISIGSVSTSATATINSVGSGAFILYGGENGPTSGVPTTSYATLTLTNSTTITATRTAASGTLVIKGCIVDGDTTNLINSIQYGTVTIANGSSSGTATISSVTNNNSVVHLQGTKSSNTSFASVQNEYALLSLSGTTVTATRGGTSGTLTVGFVVIEFQGSALNQAVQNVAATSSSSVTSYTATISSVSTSNSMLFYAGSTTASVTTNMGQFKQYGVLTNSTTVTANVNTAVANAKQYNCSVVEFVSGVLAQSAQRGTTVLSSVSSNTSTITSSTTSESALSWLGNTVNAAAIAVNVTENGGSLTNATTVTVSRSTSGANSSTGSWEVLQFTVSAAASYVFIGGFL